MTSYYRLRLSTTAYYYYQVRCGWACVTSRSRRSIPANPFGGRSPRATHPPTTRLTLPHSAEPRSH